MKTTNPEASTQGGMRYYIFCIKLHVLQNLTVFWGMLT